VYNVTRASYLRSQIYERLVGRGQYNVVRIAFSEDVHSLVVNVAVSIVSYPDQINNDIKTLMAGNESQTMMLRPYVHRLPVCLSSASLCIDFFLRVLFDRIRTHSLT
jgi:hypothetical protein